MFHQDEIYLEDLGPGDFVKVDCRVLPKAPTEFGKTRLLAYGAAGTRR